MKTGVLFLSAVMALASGTANAITLYDEAVNGDLSVGAADPNFGTLGAGINTIIGSISATGNGSDEFDGFSFTIAIDAIYTVSVFNQDSVFVNFFNFTNQGSGPITGPVNLTAGNLTFQYTGQGNTGNFGYQIDINVPGVVSVVPLPAALPLFGTGLAAMGFVGWRRKRKALAVSA